MIPHRTTIRFAFGTLFGIALCVALGCHGGSSSSTSSGPVSTFTPDTAAPGAAAVALLPGAVSGAAFEVRVTVTGVPSFFGAAFRVKYDTTALLFNGISSTSSFLRQGGVTDANVFFFEDHNAVPGEIIVTATRIDPTVAPPVDVTTTSDLILLNFTGRRFLAFAASLTPNSFQKSG